MMWWLLELLYIAVFALSWFPCCCDTSTIICCEICIDDDASFEIEMTIGGVTDGNCNCDAINGTWVAENNCVPFQECDWQYVLTSGELATLEVQSGISCFTPNQGTITLELSKTFTNTIIDCTCRIERSGADPGVWTITWRKTYPTADDIDCFFSSLSIPLASGPGGQCNRASATLSITAVV